MSNKYPILPPKDIIKALERAGFNYVSQKGSHIKYSDGKHTVIIPNHNEVARGTFTAFYNKPELILIHS